MTIYDSDDMGRLEEVYRESIFKKHLNKDERIAFEYIQGLEHQKKELLVELSVCVYHMFDPNTLVKSAVQNSAIDFIKEISGKTYKEIIDESK